MSSKGQSSMPSLSASLAQQVDAVCDRFEAAWRACRAGGPRPQLEDYLGLAGASQLAVLLRELLVLELAYRLQLGERPQPDDYRARFLEDEAAIRAAFRAVPRADDVETPGDAGTGSFPPAQSPSDPCLRPSQGEGELGHGRTETQWEQSPVTEIHVPAGDPPSFVSRYRIEKLLGQGSFGQVYLATDEQLQRLVAIKVPHRHCIATSEDADPYLTEARTVANLDHPHIVPVHDVGSSGEFPCFIVSKYIDGTDLATAMKLSRLSIQQASELVATLAEALHYAHTQGLVHRDIKPGNILLDKSNKPYLADFGLALREEDVGKGPKFAGTPAYMSPEQARGEGHRVDGRSDIFSLGIVFYGLLTRRQPFQADSQEELLEQIAMMEPRPPRQWEEAIPREVERICLKALSKRASERYPTAKEMAEDLRHFLAGMRNLSTVSVEGRVEDGEPGEMVTVPRVKSPEPTSASQPVQIIPKGLRSFDSTDADFFLSLLPGPRDRYGLPESIRFWKDRIERRDPDNTFPVGLLYGPSGCGKSSLVKAGLLPKLEKSVTVVYVEATAEETESRLLKALRRQVPALPDHLPLVESLAALRRNQFLGPGQKVLLVLDQLEQWLHARWSGKITTLIRALRHCDGARLQCLVLVRDDFWLAVSRFMKAIEVEIREGQNSALVDLFDPFHARKVLAAFGRAYGRLPENPAQCTKEQNTFLDQAVASVAQDGKVISVRLALMAEMVKGKPWTPATLKELGGSEGVGAAFLEETFAASTAPPQHRLHQRAAQVVLKALLPQGKANIKGHMRSQQELLEISGYAHRPQDFADLIRILDSDLRLISPTDPEGKNDAGSSSVQAGEKYYQLTHDYLVPSLRDWLTRKQKETRSGRAQARLAERVSLWQARREARQLPSLLEWLEIRLLTARRTWTAPEREMMRAAARKHLAAAAWVVATVSLLICLLLVVRSWDAEDHAAARAHDIVRRLLDANLAKTPAIIAELASHRRWTDPLLEKVAADPAARRDHRLRAHLALLPVDPRHADVLQEELLEADAKDFPILRDALAPHADSFVSKLWALLETPADDPRRFRAAAALASYDPESPRWEGIAPWVGSHLVKQPSLELPRWVEAVRPIRSWLIPPLAALFRSRPRSVVAAVLAEYAADQPDTLTEALAQSPPESFAILLGRLGGHKQRAVAAVSTALDQLALDGEPARARNTTAARRANLVIALMRLGAGERLWPLLKASPDPRCRSFIIDRLGPLGCRPEALLDRLAVEKDETARAALLLALGGLEEDALPQVRRILVTPRIAHIHQTDASAPVHAAAYWLLGKWGSQRSAGSVQGADDDPVRGWYVNGAGITMVKIPGPVTFLMGASPDEPGANIREKQHRVTIPHGYDMGMTEVTRGQFLHYLHSFPERDRWGLGAERSALPLDVPMTRVTWYDAAAYCNWLSQSEGIPADQWCYEPAPEGKFADGMKIVAGWQKRRGYRLPTEAEWELACRGGSAASRYYGDAEELLPRYAWYAANAPERVMPVAQLLPNAFGLFDMHGNTSEWCQDAMREPGGHPDDVDVETVRSKDFRAVRGGHFSSYARTLRSAKRYADRPAVMESGGFRLARSRP